MISYCTLLCYLWVCPYTPQMKWFTDNGNWSWSLHIWSSHVPWWMNGEPHLSTKEGRLDVIQSQPLCRKHYGQCENVSYVYCWEDLVLWRHGESSLRAWEELHLLVSGETGDTLFLHLQNLPFSLWMRACSWTTHTVFMHCWVHFTYKCIFATEDLYWLS